jgi:homoserine kinase type II
MAVYTEVSFAEAAALVARLGLGTLQQLQPCAGGIENTNYFADTDHGRFVLTLFERMDADELSFDLHLMRHLAEHSLPVPRPYPDADGELLLALKGKPAAVVARLPGEHHLAPDASDCRSVGATLARMHVAGRAFALAQPNRRGLAWWEKTVPVVLPHLTTEQALMMEDELAYQQRLAAAPAFQALPRGPIHADLFRDNVMFEGGRLTGFFDFYFAGVDTFLFDIAVCLNDWCVHLPTGAHDAPRAAAFLEAYGRVRPLTAAERRLMPAAARAGAFRFWLSRLWDLHLPREATLLQPHDPGHFERVLRERIAHPLVP